MTTTISTRVEILYPELSYQITGLCFRVQAELGRFAKEKQYCDRLELKLTEGNYRYAREFAISGTGNRVDFIVNDAILLEIKAIPFVGKDGYYQVQRYLQLLDLKLGLLINFQSRYLKPKRIINSTNRNS